MPHSITPATEPTIIVIGDTLAWTKAAPADHLASDGWTLSYDFQFPGSTSSPIAITASASGDNYSVAVTAATTAAWTTTGSAIWHSLFTKALARYQFESGSTQFVPNPAAAYGATHATRTLALIETAIEGRIPRGLESYSIQGQQIVKITITKLFELRKYYIAQVKIEKDQARLDAGLPRTDTRWARFTSAT